MIDSTLSWAICWLLQGIGACCAILWFITTVLVFFRYFGSKLASKLKYILISFLSIFTIVVLLSIVSIHVGSYSPVGGLYGVPIGSIVLVVVGFLLLLYSRKLENKEVQLVGVI